MIYLLSYCLKQLDRFNIKKENNMKTYILIFVLILVPLCSINAADFPKIKGWKPGTLFRETKS